MIDNINRLLGDDLKATVTPGARLKIAASCFSIYAFEALKKELSGVDSLQFIFTAPTFVPNEVSSSSRSPSARAGYMAQNLRFSFATSSPSGQSPVNARNGYVKRPGSGPTRPRPPCSPLCMLQDGSKRLPICRSTASLL
jgi:hypothetical protein